jgi:hypothetical protein
LLGPTPSGRRIYDFDTEHNGQSSNCKSRCGANGLAPWPCPPGLPVFARDGKYRRASRRFPSDTHAYRVLAREVVTGFRRAVSSINRSRRSLASRLAGASKSKAETTACVCRQSPVIMARYTAAAALVALVMVLAGPGKAPQLQFQHPYRHESYRHAARFSTDPRA